MRRMYSFALAAAALALSSFACSNQKSSTDSEIAGHPWIGKDAPGFTLERYVGDDQAGDAISLADYRGRFVVMHFATSW